MATTTTLQGEKILITGATSAIALPAARALARDNDVVGAARFGDPAGRRALEAAGVETIAIDLEQPSSEGSGVDALPDDVTFVLHYAYTRRPSGEFHDAIQVNAIGLGHVLQHCRQARAALVLSAATLYSVHDDPWHAYHEDDDIGFVQAPWAASSPVSKVTLEATARFCAQAFDLPVTIARPSVPYGADIDMVTLIVDSVLEDRPVFCVHDPQPLSLIHVDDLVSQIPGLLAAATVPARILNWASDEVLTVQQIAARVGELTGRTPRLQVGGGPGVAKGAVVDTTRVRELVGPCAHSLVESLPEIVAERAARAAAGAAAVS